MELFLLRGWQMRAYGKKDTLMTATFGERIKEEREREERPEQ
jgi:hypothetical protein